MKGGYLAVLHTFPSEMAQNFWLAIFAFIVCFGLTAGISLATRRTKTDEELKGLVYSLTPKIKDGGRPALRAARRHRHRAARSPASSLNLIFW